MPETKFENKVRILIVDDEVIIAADLELRLKALGYMVCAQATCGERALELVEKHHPDLVMMDIVIQGGMDGIDTAEVIRNKWGIPVIFQTAYADSERLKRARLAYPFGYLLKPYQDKDLKVTVEMALYIGRVDAKRLEAEKSIRRETAWRKMLVHGSRDGIVVLDQAGKVFEANRKFADILGYEPEEVLDLHVWDWDAQWDKDHLLHMIEIVDEQGEHFETRHRRKDGTLIDVEISTNGALQEDEKLVFCVCRDITERKQAEDLLRHSEERYRTILEIAMDGFCLVDSTGRLLQVNESYCKMTGYTEQELLSMTLNDIESLEIEETTASHLQRIIAEGKDRFESRHRKKDGSLFDVEVSMQYSDENGGLFAAFLRDITYQKRQHEDLRFQSMVLDQIRDHVTVTDLNGFILYINQVVADTLGRSRNELLGQSTITYGEDPMRGATQREIVEQAIRDGFWRGEVVNYSANGSAIFFDCRVQKIHDQQGNPASLCGIATDITERKRAEEKLKTSEECYRLIADNTTDSIWALDSGLRFTYLSPSTERLFGYTLGEWQTLDWGEFVHPEYLEKVRQLFAGIQQGETDNVAAEIKVRRKDKVELWVEYRAAAVRGRDGRLSGIVGVTRDITDRKQGEQAVRKKLAAVLEPEGDIGSLELADIIDADAVQSMMDDFYRLTNIGVAVLDLQGRILVATGWQDICTKYHRVHPTTARYCRESDLELSSGIEPGRFKAYRCKNQMWDMATPIVVGSRHMGNLFLGQFFFEDETPDRDMFRSQARRYGYDEAEYLAALERVPRWSRETVDAVMTFYAKLARIISTLSYSNVKLVRVLTEKDKLLGSLRENEAATKALLDAIPGAAFLIDPQGTIVTHNRELARRLDASERQIIGRNIYDLLPIEVASHRRSKIEEVLRTGRPLRFEDDRDDRRIYNSIYPVIDPEGRVGRLAVFGADITESKKAKKALQESEQRKELALAGAKLGTWDWNVATGEVIFDERWAEILGYRLDELEPQVSAWERLIHPADVQDVMSILDDHLAGLSEHYETEYRLRHKDGHFVWILDKGRVIERDAESNPVRVCGTHLDITKRKIAEERRQEGFNLLNNLARLVPGVIYQYKLNPDGSSAFPYSSPGMWDIYEVTPEEVREDASVVFGRLHPEDHDRVAEAIFESARTLNTFQCELRVILPEQGLRWRWSQAHPERTEDGGTLWHGIILDITESKQAKEALEKSEERHRTILKTAMDGLWLVDLDGRILQVNDAYCRMSGYTEQELLSMKLSDLDVDESPFDTASHLEKIIDQGVDRFETRHRRKNGDVFEVEISTTYQPLEGGRIVGFLRDITDSRKAAEEREKLQAQLQQAQKMGSHWHAGRRSLPRLQQPSPGHKRVRPASIAGKIRYGSGIRLSESNSGRWFPGIVSCATASSLQS